MGVLFCVCGVGLCVFWCVLGCLRWFAFVGGGVGAQYKTKILAKINENTNLVAPCSASVTSHV